MKTMTCRQVGGACAKVFRADSFEEIAELSRQHGMEMVRRQDRAHIEAMNRMRVRMERPGAMQEWLEAKRRDFDALPEDGRDGDDKQEKDTAPVSGA